MADNRITTAPAAPEQPTVAALHEKWRKIIRHLNNVPGIPDRKRERELTVALEIEKQIAALPSRTIGEVVSKLVTAKTCLNSLDMALIDSAVSDLRRLDPDMPVSGGST